MDSAAGWLLLHFGTDVVCAHGMVLVPSRIASAVLETARLSGLRTLGAEGFEFHDDGKILARLDRIADFSYADPHDLILDDWAVDDRLFVEFVFDTEPQTVFVIDGADFDDLPGFFHVASKALMNTDWEITNLDGFNDILRGDSERPRTAGTHWFGETQGGRREFSDTLRRSMASWGHRARAPHQSRKNARAPCESRTGRRREGC